MTVAAVLSPHEAVTNPAVYQNCSFALDSESQTKTINEILNGTFPYLKFKNCLIEYHGGEIKLILAWDKMPFTITLAPPPGLSGQAKTVHTDLSGPTLRFEDCIFNFSIQNVPPQRGQELSANLLAENFTLPVSK